MAPGGALEHALQREHVARVLQVGRVQVQAQRVARKHRRRRGSARGRACAPGRRSCRMLQAGASSRPRRPSASSGGAVHAEQAGPPAKAPGQHAAQGGRVGVGGRDEAVGLDAGELEHAPAGAAPRGASPRCRGRRTRRCAARARAASSGAAKPRRARALVLKAVLGDRVAGAAALAQPAAHLRRALAERVQVARGDHQQRHAIDAVVVQPVADQRAALERRRLDVVQRDGDRARRARATRHAALAPIRRPPSARR